MPASLRSYSQSLILVAAAVLVGIAAVAEPALFVSVALLLVLAWVSSPLFFPGHRDFETARERAAVDRVPLVLWRPGCMFCIRLRLTLGLRGGRLCWVDIWRSPAAAAFVRAHNDGNETVPTVVVGSVVRTNPAPSWVREQLEPSPRQRPGSPR